jgi:uncharacterized protein
VKTLRISDDLPLPLEVVTEKLAFLGRTGSGKSYAATKLAELMFDADAQFIAYDPVGVWPGLRMGPGAIDVPVFGGLYGDLPLEATAGALIVDVILDRSLSAVVDVSQMLPSEQVRFSADFAARLFQRKKSERGALHLFLEECQEVVPQNYMGGEERMLGAFVRMWKLGRNFGIGGSLISQRPQEVSKKVLNMTEVLFAFQMNGPQERKAIEAWVADKGLDVGIVKVLPGLEVGEPHVWSPRLLKVSEVVRIAAKRTFDLSSTPKVGDKRKAAQPLKPVDLEKLRGEMAATIEKAKSDDPKELRRRIAELEKQLDAKGNAPLLAKQERVEVVTKVDVPVFKAEHVAAVKRVEALLGKTAASLAVVTAAVDASVRRSASVDQQIAAMQIAQPVPPAAVARQPAQRAPASHPSPRNGSAHGSGPLAPGLVAILTAVAQRLPDRASREYVTVMTGYKRSTRNLYVQQLTAADYLAREGDMLVATPAGVAALGPNFEPLPVGDELRAHWLRELPEGERRVLEILSSHYPKSVTRDLVGEESGYKRSTRNLYLQRLSTRGLTVSSGDNVAAADLLFS